MAAAAPPGPDPPAPSIRPETILLGGVGLLTALVGVLATANGGIDRIERNERWPLFAGTVCVLVAVAVGSLYTALTTTRTGAAAAVAAAPARPRSRLGRLLIWPFVWFARLLRRIGLRLLVLVGLVALAGGLITVAFAAVTHVGGRPGITASLSSNPKLGLLLAGNVTVSDISSTTHLEMRVDALIPGIVAGKPRLVSTAIYAASFGPNSSGDVDHAYQVAIPNNTYQVLVQAWTGSYGYCFNAEIPKRTAQTPIANDLGCLRVRIPPPLTAGRG